MKALNVEAASYRFRSNGPLHSGSGRIRLRLSRQLPRRSRVLARKSNRFNLSPSAGFSLVEVLVALFVFATVSVVFSQAFFNTLTALEQKAKQTANESALRFVRSQVILEPDLEEFEDGGEIETLDAGIATWQAEVEATEIPHLFQVSLQIEFEGSEEVEPWTHEESLHLLRPTWSELGDADDLQADIESRLLDDRDSFDWQ